MSGEVNLRGQLADRLDFALAGACNQSHPVTYCEELQLDAQSVKALSSS